MVNVVVVEGVAASVFEQVVLVLLLLMLDALFFEAVICGLIDAVFVAEDGMDDDVVCVDVFPVMRFDVEGCVQRLLLLPVRLFDDLVVAVVV